MKIEMTKWEISHSFVEEVQDRKPVSHTISHSLDFSRDCPFCHHLIEEGSVKLPRRPIEV